MKNLVLLLCMLVGTIASTAFAQVVPKDTLKANFSTFIDQNSKSSDNSTGASIRITSKASYFRYGIISFDMSKVSSMRNKAEIGLLVYSSASDDYFKTGVGDFPLAIYAMKRKPSLPTSFLRFFNTATDDPAGDGFAVTGTYPKSLSAADGEKLGTITVTKSDQDSFVKLDITDFVNKNINGSDTIYFFVTSDATANGTVSLWIRSAAYGPVSAPKVFLYDEKPVTVMQGGRDIYVGEKDSVRIFFPPSAVAPCSVTYTDGTTPVTVNGITAGSYAFEVTPTANVTYSITASSDANGAIAVDGSATFNVLTPNAVLSGMNKIYAGQESPLTVEFKGIPPFGFTYNTPEGTPVTVSGITSPTCTFMVAPTATFSYSLASASDKNNASIAVSGTPVVTVIAPPAPVLASGADEWKICFGEEFGKADLDTKIWSVSSGSPVVANDELRLPINSNGTSYVSSQVKLIEQLPNNTDMYIEMRVKPLDAAGTSTTLNTQTYNTQLASKYENRYSMGFPVMNGYGGGQYNFSYSLGDWKTNYYATEINPNISYYVVSDSLKNQTVIDYKVFGVSISSKDIVYYIDGVEVKRASNMSGYNSGELVDALKAAAPGSALEDVAQKAYGYYGQNDWNYNAGYTGDLMAFFLGTSFRAAEVQPSVDGQYASVDYVRIFKPVADMNETPVENITFDNATSVTLTGTASKENKQIELSAGSSASFALSQEYGLNETATRYFSTIVKKSADGEFTLSLTNPSGQVQGAVVIDQYNQLQTGFGANKLYYASTVSAEPTGRKSSFIRNDEPTLLIGRIQTSASGDDILSIALMPVMGDHSYPFFYPNIEGEYGHTAINNKWDLNYKYEAGSGKIAGVKLQAGRAETSVQKFMTGDGFQSVIPKESFATFTPNLFYVASGTQVEIEVQLQGTAPWTLTYSDGKQSHTINDITTPTLKIPVAAEKTTTYTLTGLTDGNGLEGIVFGEQQVKVKSPRAMLIYPSFDTYVYSSLPDATYWDAATGNIKKDASYAREAFFRYDISEFGRNDSIDVASLSIFFTGNDKGTPVVLSAYSVEGGLPGDIEDLCWNNRPDEINYKFITDITLPNPGFTGIRGSWDVSSFINQKLRSGAGIVNISVKSTGGDGSALLTWRQFVPDSIGTPWEAQFPALELDPYSPTGIETTYGGNQSKLNVYPNPVTDGYFYVKASAEANEADIYNLAGILVARKQILNGKVSTSGLTKGTYLLRVKTAKGNFHGKLVIQ
ncbi:MAG: T9SS type A sorting domain-containing protein [Prevotella sp.]|jgi:hypothetical protein|nr:T9SS type A sorting domain-containing protein [Prevotella sp.]